MRWCGFWPFSCCGWGSCWSLSRVRGSLASIGTHEGSNMTEEKASAPRSASDLRAHMKRTHRTAIYPFAGLANVQGLMYVGLGLAGEAGEIANQVKTIARDDSGIVSGERRSKILDEMGDVMWYWLRLCHELGFDPYDVLEHNETKLAARATAGTLSGDQRGGLFREAAAQWEK